MLAVGGKAPRITVFRASGGRLTESLHVSAPGTVNGLALNDGGTVLVTGGEAKVVEVWGCI